MLKYTVSATAIALALAMTTPRPAAAQEVVSEPGNCAFFYPYANCQNKGPGNPDTDPYFRRSLAFGQAPWPMATSVGLVARRARHYRSDGMKRWE
jgi:hypothetical protein